MITIATAAIDDIWPNTIGGCPHPDDVRDEIMRTAKSIPLIEIEKYAVKTGQVSWYCAYALAEQRVLNPNYQPPPPPPPQEASTDPEVDRLRRQVANLNKDMRDSWKAFNELVSDHMCKVIGQVIGQNLKALREELNERLVALEQRPTVQYRGVYSATAEYHPGDMITFNGSVWHGKMTCTVIKPPDSNSWQLAVKRKKDGDGPK
jgi:hypothetical protein